MTWKPGEKIFNDVAALKRELMQEEPQESWDGDQMVRLLFIGTVFSLMPSSKFYTPWAASNLEPCPTCGGKGDVPAAAAGMGSKREAFHQIARGADWAMRKLAMELYGPAANGQWPQPLCDALACTMQAHDMLGATQTCPGCEGCGSVEAMLDEKWREQAEEELEAEGMWLENGEGDPCDLFVGMTVDEDEED